MRDSRRSAASSSCCEHVDDVELLRSRHCSGLGITELYLQPNASFHVQEATRDINSTIELADIPRHMANTPPAFETSESSYKICKCEQTFFPFCFQYLRQ